MRVVVRRLRGLRHEVVVRGYRLVVDEPHESGGTDAGPTPLELLAAAIVACAAGSIHRHARNVGWAIEDAEVEATYTLAERRAPTAIKLVLRLPDTLHAEQVEHLSTVALTGPVCRTLVGDVEIEQSRECLPCRTPAPLKAPTRR